MKHVFNDFRHIKNTKSPHRCIICTRCIPPGHKAHNYVGEYEGEFQNWYTCDYCYQNDLIPYNEEISCDGQEFYSHIEVKFECEECGSVVDPCIRRNKENPELYIITCQTCGNKTEIHIPFDID